MRTRLLFIFLAVTAVANAGTRLLAHVPLEWRPTSALRLGAMQMPQTAIRFAPFEDVRTDKQAIGENREDAQPKPVTTDALVSTVSSMLQSPDFQRALSGS